MKLPWHDNIVFTYAREQQVTVESKQLEGKFHTKNKRAVKTGDVQLIEGVTIRWKNWY